MPIQLKIPAAGESITEVYVGEWYKSVGDWVDKDEEVVELETDKATHDLPSPAAEALEDLKQSGETANVGEVIGYIEASEKPAEQEESRAAEGEESKRERRVKGGKEAKKPAKQPVETSAEREPRQAKRETDGPRIMPAAARLLAEHGLAAEDVKATGRGGRLLTIDVVRHLEHEEERGDRAEQARDRHEEAVRISPIRRRIAERLVKAQQTAALLTTFNEIDMSAVQNLREQYREAFLKKYDLKLGFMSFFVKAAVDALNLIPQVNAEIRGEEIVYRNYCDIGIAVGSGKGLVVPVLRNAERMSFAEIELAVADFARRAQENELSVEELQGGTFTISNGGVYGSLLSTPIVNPPQSGVLGMHAIQDRPVVRGGEIVARPMMYVALTYDHRVVDGREAVTFLKRIKEVIEEPARLILEV